MIRRNATTPVVSRGRAQNDGSVNEQHNPPDCDLQLVAEEVRLTRCGIVNLVRHGNPLAAAHLCVTLARELGYDGYGARHHLRLAADAIRLAALAALDEEGAP